MEARVEAMERAVDKAERAMVDRLHGMNEIREAMREQSSTFVTRIELYWAVATMIAIVGLASALVRVL